jgi:hypothetical protein
MELKKKSTKDKKKNSNKKIRTKLYTKNKWKKTFVFYQGERKKSQSASHCRSAAETLPSTSKILMCHS